jgi:hypothetical protein
VNVLTDSDLETLQLDQMSLRRLPRRTRIAISNLDHRIGRNSRILIASATAAIPFTVHPIPNADSQFNQILGHQILETHPSLSGAKLRYLQSLILNPTNHYGIRHIDCWRLPEVAIRFMANFDLPVLIDFRSEGWCIKKEWGASAPSSRFTPVAAELSTFLSPYRIQQHHGVSVTLLE